MSEVEKILELIEEGLVKHGGDLGGWTKRGDETLQIFDGRVTLHVELGQSDPNNQRMVHAHVLATLAEHDDEVLDACIVGVGDNRQQAVAQVAYVWIMSVAGPIRSFLDNKPVCMTCQAGVIGGNANEGYSAGDYGLPGLRAYVGPAFARGFANDPPLSRLDDTKPWFRFAAESAAPRRVHLAKATILSKGAEGWTRDLEIDGHDVSYHEPSWPAGIASTSMGVISRFAVFEFPRNSAEIARRSELERTIRYFAEHYSKYESVDQLMDVMVDQGFDPDFVHDVESISTIAFGRTFFEPLGMTYPETVIVARRNGQVDMDVSLMSLPAYTRARAVAVQLRDSLSADAFQMLCFYNAESHAILQAAEAQGKMPDLSSFKLYPCVVHERGCTDETSQAAVAKLHELVNRSRTKKKPWWKFW